MTEVRPLRAYAEVSLGRQRSPSTQHGPHMVPYVRAANVRDGRLDLSDVKEMNFTPDEQELFSLRRGDVLVTEGSGSLRAVGKSAVWNNELPDPVCFQNTVLRLRPRPMTDARFLAWWCRHAYVDGLFASVSTGSNIFHISADRVRSLPVTYVALERQRAIADHLDTETARIDALITKKRRMVQLLDQRLSAVVSQVVWSSTPVRTRLKFACGPATSGNRDHQGFTEDGSGVPCLRGLNVRPLMIDRTDLLSISDEAHQQQRATWLRAGDIVVVRSGLAGAAAAVPPELEGANCVDLVIVHRAAGVEPRWMEYVLNSRETQEQVKRRHAGAILTHFNAVDAGDLEVPALPPVEQRRSSATLDTYRGNRDELAARLTRQIELLVEHREALITAAVTGELDVPGVAA